MGPPVTSSYQYLYSSMKPPHSRVRELISGGEDGLSRQPVGSLQKCHQPQGLRSLQQQTAVPPPHLTGNPEIATASWQSAVEGKVDRNPAKTSARSFEQVAPGDWPAASKAAVPAAGELVVTPDSVLSRQPVGSLQKNHSEETRPTDVDRAHLRAGSLVTHVEVDFNEAGTLLEALRDAKMQSELSPMSALSKRLVGASETTSG